MSCLYITDVYSMDLPKKDVKLNQRYTLKLLDKLGTLTETLDKNNQSKFLYEMV